jgi:hypothetical protein
MMTKQRAKTISDDALRALQAVAAQHGLTVACKGGTFTGATFVPKFEFAEAGAERATFVTYAKLLGLDAADFGATFRTAGGRVFKITGLKTSARTQPILVEDLQGTRYKMRVSDVVEGLRRERALAVQS